MQKKNGLRMRDSKGRPPAPKFHVTSEGLESDTSRLSAKVYLTHTLSAEHWGGRMCIRKNQTSREVITFDRTGMCGQTGHIAGSFSLPVGIFLSVYRYSLPCEGYTRPNQTTKKTKMTTKGITTTSTLTGSMNPAGALAIAGNYAQAKAIENQNDRITPKWIVDYEDGGWGDSEGQYYWEQNVSYTATDNRQHQL
ncbi:hypothetical protein C8R44DRAFT_750805 [Mycena epipterygia]|nr:hypothetical protein C8R44DRAFT_750805 [Mycena epipterygia]